jgi:hypothetical protein
VILWLVAHKITLFEKHGFLKNHPLFFKIRGDSCKGIIKQMQLSVNPIKSRSESVKDPSPFLKTSIP